MSRDGSSGVVPLDVSPRYRVRWDGIDKPLVSVRIDVRRGELVVTLPNGQWFLVLPEDALALTAVLTVAVGDSYPHTSDTARFDVDRSIGEGRWEPWNGYHRDGASPRPAPR